MTAKEVSRELQCSYTVTLKLIQEGFILATKEKGRWNITESELKNFKKRNDNEIRCLRKEYMQLYFEGLELWNLQKRVSDDFKLRGIIHQAQGFVEKTIYDHIMNMQKTK